jgi:hypothetical protein
METPALMSSVAWAGVEMAGERVFLPEVFDDRRIHVFTLPCAKLPDNWESNLPCRKRGTRSSR